MSRLSLTVLLIAGLISSLSGPGVALAAPRIAAEETVFSWGDADETTPVEHTFVIRNDGDQPLTIDKVESSCGCTTTRLDGTTIPPGGTTGLTAKINLRGRRGHQEKSIYISSNDPARPQFTLKMTGSILVEVEVDPQRLDFLDMKSQQEVTRTVKVENRTGPPLHITGVTQTGDFFSVSSETIRENEAYLVTVRTTPPLPMGVNRGVVTILTDNPKYPSIVVPVNVQVPKDIVVAPSVLALTGAEGVSSPRTLFVAVRSRSHNDFKITRVEAPAPDITVKVEKLAVGSFKIALGNVEATAKLDNSWLRIFTDDEESAEVSIPFRVIPRRRALPDTGLKPQGGGFTLQ